MLREKLHEVSDLSKGVFALLTINNITLNILPHDPPIHGFGTAR